jgi:hypothetical protein
MEFVSELLKHIDPIQSFFAHFGKTKLFMYFVSFLCLYEKYKYIRSVLIIFLCLLLGSIVNAFKTQHL